MSHNVCGRKKPVFNILTLSTSKIGTGYYVPRAYFTIDENGQQSPLHFIDPTLVHRVRRSPQFSSSTSTTSTSTSTGAGAGGPIFFNPRKNKINYTLEDPRTNSFSQNFSARIWRWVRQRIRSWIWKQLLPPTGNFHLLWSLNIHDHWRKVNYHLFKSQFLVVLLAQSRAWRWLCGGVMDGGFFTKIIRGTGFFLSPTCPFPIFCAN